MEEDTHNDVLVKRRGRKSGLNSDEFLRATTGVTFIPNREVREQLIYCMQETGVFNKSALVTMAIKHFYDALQNEAIRRAQMANE